MCESMWVGSTPNARKRAICALISASTASGLATANAGIGFGYIQVANAGLAADVGLDNDGLFYFGAVASALGASADANASAFVPILQVANGDNATIALTNSGTIQSGAGAFANATAFSADALAQVFAGIVQTASATAVGGIASLTIANDGIIQVIANAEATANLAARADAIIGVGIAQVASGDTATIAFTNVLAGDVFVGANASASGFCEEFP